MPTPYVSHPKLFENAQSAMLAAIELFNKPRIPYRSETTVILAVNAWELALKGRARQANKRIFKKKLRNSPYESITIDQSLNLLRIFKLWPEGMDGEAISVNIRALADYRNRATHLYNASGLGAVIYTYLQQSVLNFRDFMVAASGKDLAESITWDLLPLGATTPSEAVQFMRVDAEIRSVPAISEFLDSLRQGIESIEQMGGDTSRIYTYYDLSMHSKKTATAADLSVAVDPESGGKVVRRTYDPNKGHPLNATELLAKVNAKRDGPQLTTYDRDAAVWHSQMKANEKYAWKHAKALSHVWSYDAVNFLSKQDDAYFDAARKAYKTR